MAGGKNGGKSGWVYAVSNPSMPGILKIGRTARDPEARLREMNSRTETPTPFRIEAVIRTANAAWTERAVHERLESMRVNARREFFRITPASALATMKAVAREQRQISFDRAGWNGAPPTIGAFLVTVMMTPIVGAIEARLVAAWLGACAFAYFFGRPRILREFLNISRWTGSPLLAGPSVVAAYYACSEQNLPRELWSEVQWIWKLSLAAVRGTLGT